MTCRARQQADQMYCAHCVLTWDVNDPEPPPCNLKGRQVKASQVVEQMMNCKPITKEDLEKAYPEYDVKQTMVDEFLITRKR